MEAPPGPQLTAAPRPTVRRRTRPRPSPRPHSGLALRPGAPGPALRPAGPQRPQASPAPDLPGPSLRPKRGQWSARPRPAALATARLTHPPSPPAPHNIIEDSRVFLFYPYSPFHFKCFLEQKIIFIATISMMRIVQIQCRSFGCVLDGEEPC